MLFSFIAYCVVLLTFWSPSSLAETNATINTSESQVEETTRWSSNSITRKEFIYPSNFGSAGLFRTRSAESLPQGALAFGMGIEFYSVTNAPFFFGSQTARTVAENLFVGFSPVENLTLSLQRRSSSTTLGRPEVLISSLGDINLSGLYSIPVNSLLVVAPFVDIQFASNFNSISPSGNTASIGVGGAATASLYSLMGIPFWAHFNLKYHIPQIRTFGPATIAPETFFDFSRFHTVTLALGGEMKLGDFMPFAEVKQTFHTDSALSFGNSPSQLTVGTRILPFSNKSLSFLIGADIGLVRKQAPGVPFNPSYQILGQVSYTVGLGETKRKHYVTDQNVRIVDRKFILSRDIKFKINSAQLTEGSVEFLRNVASIIEQNEIQKLLIVGHTDSTATVKYNLNLSQKRADVVKRQLVKFGVDREKLLTKGKGKSKPIASNITDEGRAKNRRVAFYILE